MLILSSQSACNIARKDKSKESLIPEDPIYEVLTCKDLRSFIFLENIMGEM